MTQVRLGLLGCGTVGGSLVTLLANRHDAIQTQTGVDLQINAIAVGDPSKDRGLDIDSSVFTGDAAAVVANDAVDMVVELIGGVDLPRELVLSALQAGKPVVTGNKALLAAHGQELYAAAEAAGVDLLFEAAVAAAIPIIRPLRESLRGDKVTKVLGILNGTTNYMLSKMTDEGASYDAILAEAQALGYAEADPTADVGGFDAGAKIAIIASLAFGVNVTHDDVVHQGITEVSSDDIAVASRLGHKIKLLAIAEQSEDGSVSVRVHPAMVPDVHPLASVSDSFNAIFVEGEAFGELMFYGRGAGGPQTASAVLGDVVDAARNLGSGTSGFFGPLPAATITDLAETCSAFHLGLEVTDAPGVLAEVAQVFGSHGVSIQSMEQSGEGDNARLVFITHCAKEDAMNATLADLGQLETVRSVGSVIRVIGD